MAADDKPLPSAEHARVGARLRTGTVDQRKWGPRTLDETLAQDHPARAIHALIGKLDLEDFYRRIGSRLGAVGAPAIDPRILLTLWFSRPSEGISSAREITELCRQHDAYRWLCRGVPVEYRTLSTFRETSGKLFDELITKMLALLMQHELVDLHRIAQDGTRVRASAGAASFRRQQTLEQLMTEARAHLERVTSEGHDPALGAPIRRGRLRHRKSGGLYSSLDIQLEAGFSGSSNEVAS
jgi:transposase